MLSVIKCIVDWFGDCVKKLIIIPAYNEEDNIVNVYQKIKKYDDKKNYDIIVINDGSTDKTEDILKKNKIPHITLVNNLGIGGAVQTGYKYAYNHKYDIAIQFDGDGQHSVENLEDIVKPIEYGKANMVIGSRFIDKSSSDFKSTKARRVGINIISFFIKLVTKKKIFDTTSGFRAIDRNLIKYFSKNYPVEYPEPVSTTNVLINDYIIDEVPVKMNERENGISSIRKWKNVYYMFNVILSILTVGMEGKSK